jgi:2-oxoglutarate dehydrogenase E2 component (dihydrolipoamide succinyltransferase)
VSPEIRVPRLAESISDAVLVEWLKPEGAVVKIDEPIATLETDKAAVEIAADAAGTLHHASAAGDRVVVGQVIARIDGSGVAAAGSAAGVARSGAPVAPSGAPVAPASAPGTATIPGGAPTARPVAPPGTVTVPGGASERAGATVTAAASTSPSTAPVANASSPSAPLPLRPSVRRLVEEHALDANAIAATGPGEKLLKEDVLRHIESAAPEASRAMPLAPPPAPLAAVVPADRAADGLESDERVVPMSRLRQRIAQRLVEAQNTAAILTTFNEIDMTAVLDLRARHKDAFEKKHGVKLGFMSLFGMASIQSLADTPELNAEIRGTDIVYRRHVHLGVAVGTPRGLVVPVVRRADTLDLAALEREIARLATRAREGSLSLDEMAGGTFTISNGGVYGSLLSTPILNPPQSGILGMHKIEKRPVAISDQVVIRPMMYVALSYDHRIIDGEQAVTFLVHVKDRIEDPERMLLQV